MTTSDTGLRHGELVTHASFLHALARGLLADEHLSEDVVQQAFLRALARPPVDRGRLHAWLARVVRNLALNAVRGESRRRERERAAAREDSDAAHQRATLELALQSEVAGALAGLPEPLRTVIHLRYFRGRGRADIARALGVSPSTVESRLTRAHALLRRRLDKAWREQSGEVRALYMALVPSAPGSTILGGLWMTKQTLVIGLGAVSLIGLLLTWRALEREHRAAAEEGANAKVALLEASEPLAPPEPSAAVREEFAPTAAPPTVPSSAPSPDADAELRQALARLAPILDRSLEGRLDPGAILDAALLVAAKEAGDPLAELDAAGRLLIPIADMPEGAEAELCVSPPHRSRETVLTLQVRFERARGETLVHDNWERGGPELQVTTRTDEAGELRQFSILTSVPPERRTAGLLGDPPRWTYGASLYTPMAAPHDWKLKMQGMEAVEGTLQADGGRTYRSGGWDVPQVLDGGAWPRVEDMQRLSQRLLDMHAAVKSRAQR